MITLDNHLADYVALRRRMGFVVRNDTFALKGFVRFCNAAGTDTVTTDLVVDWAIPWPATSRSTSTALTKAIRFHRPGWSLEATCVGTRTSTPTTTLALSSTPRSIYEDSFGRRCFGP